MELIRKILSRPEFTENPPILVDIGASGAIHPKWRAIAPYSICIASDADDRDMGYSVNESSGYRKLFVYNSIITDFPVFDALFYLTSEPHCSSLLKPWTDRLKNWEFSDLFTVQRTMRLKTVTLPQVLSELGIDHVDWFKTDSQGIDLRLFKSLGDKIVDRVIVAEFEPGIMDAYEGEDKLWQVMQFMERHPFWMSGIIVKGSLRLKGNIITERFHKGRGYLSACIRTAPGWGEATFMHTFEPGSQDFGIREYLLGWVFAVIERQPGFALEIALAGKERFRDPVFVEMEEYVVRKLTSTVINKSLCLARRVLNKIIRTLDRSVY
jgi:hypothetical protein